MCASMFQIPIEEKSNEKALKARIDGNDRFQTKNYFYALYFYNKSITFAESKDVAALGYANRSAVYFEVKLYEECLENIQLARKNDYPADKMSKLIEREAKCKELMQHSMNEETEDLWSYFKLSYPANEKVPWVVDCVEMRWTEKYGRGIYAKQDLKAGDIICVEELFFNYTCSNEYNHYLHCYNCFKSKRMNLIPCDRTASMMFCSVACMEELYSKAVSMDAILCADIKLLSDVFRHFYRSLMYFEDYMKRTDLKKLNKTIFDYDLSNPDDLDYKNKLMNCFLSLSTNKNRTKEHRCIETFVSEKASHHLLSILDLNQKELYFSEGDRHTLITGCGISLFASLINHCCIRNAQFIPVDNKMVTFLVKPVKAGEQIFFCYTPYSIIFDDYLKKTLEAKYLFKCDCVACKKGSKKNEREFYSSVELTAEDLLAANPAYERDYIKAKEYLKKSWDEINKNPPVNQLFKKPFRGCLDILESIAFQCSYPFISVYED